MSDELDERTDGVPVALWAGLLLEARRLRGLSQPQLAEAAGVAQQTISKIERAQLCPHDRAKVRLARALGVHVSDLFPWPREGEPPPRLVAEPRPVAPPIRRRRIGP